MKKLHFLPILAVVFALCATGCKPDPEVEQQFAQYTLTVDNPLALECIEHDPTAAYPVAITLKINAEGQIVAEGGQALPTEQALSNNLPNNPCKSTARIADCGEVKGLSKVTKYPEEDQYAPNQVAALEHGYVIEAHGAHNVSSYGIPALQDPASVYMRVYLEEEVVGGYKIRYEIPFVAE